MTTYQIVRAAGCPHCHVGKGFPCRVGRTTKPGFIHPRRRDAAENGESHHRSAA